MGFNMYKQIPKIRNDLKEKGFENDIPLNEVKKAMMVMFGMKEQTVVRWIRDYERNNVLIVDIDTLEVNFL